MLVRRGARLCVETFLQSPPELYRLSRKFKPEDLPNIPESTVLSLNRIIDLSEETHQLRLKRMQLLSLPTHSVQGRNKELLSLGVAAVSGALSLSIHPGFAVIFLFSYRMYRTANEPTRDRLNGPQSAKLIQKQISDINDEINLHVVAITKSQKKFHS